MADEFAPSSPTSETPPPRTTGGNWRWEPPTAVELQNLMPGYTIEKILGRGGMGAVYRGVQTNLDRPVAIKILPPGVEKEDPSFAERFKSEARLMAKLNHPAVVAVYDFGTTSAGQLYFAMEYVDGSDVSQMIAAQGKLPPEHALAITAHVCDALSAAHELGIVHRDIKPANVLLNMKGQVKVADFGLAKVEEPGSHGLTKTGYAMGTPDFVAPEALTLGTGIDGRADLYAVGVMLYQMLTGNIPRGAFRPASVLVPGLDPRFDAIIMKAMQHDRSDRHQDAMELRRELDVILTVPFVRNDAPVSAAIPIAQVEEVPGQRSAAQRPQQRSAGAPTRQPSVKAGKGTRAPETPPKSKTPLFIGLGAAAAIGIGAFVVFSGGRADGPPSAAMPPQTALGGQSAPPAKPTSVASATPKPTALKPPTPKPTSSPASSVSSSPSLPLSKSSEPQFPPGKWVKVFTKAEDLPESLRKPGTGVKWENGTVTATKAAQYLGLYPALGVMRNLALRGEISGSFTIRLRDNPAANYYGFWQNTIEYYDRKSEDKSRAKKVLRTFASPSASEVHSWEFAAVGTTLTARLNGKIVASVTDSQVSSGMITFSNLVGSFKNLEVINLDDLSEAEALKILGVDEKGNDLRKPAAVATTAPASSVPASNASRSDAGGSMSSPLPVSAVSEKFPPGKWVKITTNLDEMKTNGVAYKGPKLLSQDGWLVTSAKPVDLRINQLNASNLGVRIVHKRPAKTIMLDLAKSGKGSRRMEWNLEDGTLSLKSPGTVSPDLYRGIHLPKNEADHVELEFVQAAGRYLGRVNGKLAFTVELSPFEEAFPSVYVAEAFRDIEVINLDGLPEAEALRILGVDEKGNDLRALAAKQEQQMAEQAKVVDALAAIPELKALHEQFVKLQAERVTAPFEAEVAKLNAGYVGGIDREIAHEKKAGNLDGVIALEAEKKLIQGVGTSLSPQTRDQDGPAPSPIPAEDDAATANALKKLRGIYREAYAKIDATRAKNLKALTDPLSVRLQQLVAALTQQDRVADAKKVREYREALEGSQGVTASSRQPIDARRLEAVAPIIPTADGFTNSLGMKFLPVKGTDVLFCIHETRRQDYAAYANEVPGVNGLWKNQMKDGVPCGDKDDHPVVGVSWDSAAAFCVWLSEKEGKTYRLPTDREWSHAVGIGRDEKWTKTSTPENLKGQVKEFPWGGDFPPETKDLAGNYGDSAWHEKFPTQPWLENYSDGFPTTAPVMSFKPNKFGLYDMGGNVREWVEGWWNEAQADRVMRGAFFGHITHDSLLSSFRDHAPPSRLDGHGGFRVVLEVK